MLFFKIVPLIMDLTLRLVEAERRGDFDPSRARQVFVEVKLLLQFRQLFVGEVRSVREFQDQLDGLGD
jgi:hypothetical protein